jgi:deoxycytidine triphosphate deaminase
MSVLNIEALRDLADNHNLLGDNFDCNNFQPSSYDLRIGTIYKDGRIYSKSHPDKNCYFISVKPSEIITLLTLEEINIPQNCCGTVFALNRFSSTGLLILNPGHVDPGFEGPISICAINLSKEPIKLSLEDDIFTLIIDKLDEGVPKESYYINKKFSSRKELEEKQYKTRFENLSKSFFDLVVGYEKANKLLIDRIYTNFTSYFKKLILILVPICAILAGVYLLFPDLSIFKTDSKESIEIENFKTIEIYKDSIVNLNNQIQNLSDSEINK